MNRSRPSTLVSTLVVVALVCLWGWLRLYLFAPLTFVLPLLVCVWTRRRWQLWMMAALFVGKAIVKTFWLLPPETFSATGQSIFLGSTLLNILIGAAVVHAIIVLRLNLENHNATISAQNAELEAHAEEVSQQNEEIKAQAEELAQQNEEIEAQAEEVTRQNEDLLDLNTRLSGREDILQGLLHASRELDSIPRVLDELCRRALSVIGSPAAAVAILQRNDPSLEVLSYVSASKTLAVPDLWPLKGSIAEVVLREKRTAYVSDLTRQPELAQPFGAEGDFKSVLATPVSLAGTDRGLLVACSSEPAHWTEEQFRVIEWVAGQCGLIMETLHNQKALAEHASALEAAHRSKDTFLAMLSHELRTPLTPILISSGMLAQDTRLPQDVLKQCQMILRNVAIQSRLIDDLLDLTRVSRGTIELDNQVLPVLGLVRDAAQIVSSDIKAKSLTLELQLVGINNHAVVGDGPRLQQVFWNVLKNAIRFSNPGATISIRGRLHDQRVLIEVTDQGCGIHPSDLGRIFLPFEQIQTKPRNANEGGLGLGLAIAKAIVEKHGGSISARSDGIGHGATFAVELPVATLSPTQQSPAVFDPTFHVDGHPPLNILLVEDHTDTAIAIAGLLHTLGSQVSHAETAAEALELFQNTHFDLVISDLGLPDENGFQLMQRLRAVRPALPAICISGHGMEQDIAQCRAAGFADHLTKPIESHRLRSSISRVLSKAAPRDPPDPPACEKS
jgi:signal transduction histidine kinase/ActR/RegA family two-component response regulator